MKHRWILVVACAAFRSVAKSRMLLPLVASVAISGCALIDNKLASWVGHHQSELIASWGPPQQIMDVGEGEKIFIYADTRSFTSPGRATTNVTGSAYGVGSNVYGNATGYTTYTPPQTTSYAAYRMFWVDQSGHIYRWAWKGF